MQSINETLEGNANFYFSTVSMSTCHWDFGDGTEEVIGEGVEHTYSAPGVYEVTITYIGDGGEILAQVKFEVKVLSES